MFPDYVLHDTLNVYTPDGDNGINNNDDENYNYNDLNDNDDGQTIMIPQTMHFVEPFLCEKLNFWYWLIMCTYKF